MRLLQRNDTGEICLTKIFVGDNTPRYAILSHTWGVEEEEVSYKDLTDGTGKIKLGYDKIRFCGDQAWNDGLQYFWIDTCCIDKSNSVELQEAINSMFRWYRDAAKCYVYLADVSTPPFDANDKCSQLPWDSAFRKSRWFTRGWTLQELIAPASAEFLSKEGVRLGNKRSLEQHIHDITGIPVKALQGSPLSDFSVSERMAWIEKRETTRKEDMAYSLLGIFDVRMRLDYGEGRESAFKRLREKLNKASKSEQTHDESEDRCLTDLRSTDPRHDKIRIEDTKGGLLRDSYRWVLDNVEFQRWRNDERSRLLWIKGDPGKGKTMLLCGIIDELSPSTKLVGHVDGSLLSYVFCQATDSRINSATAVLRGLIYLLAKQQPSLLSHIRKEYDHAGKRLFEDVNAWVALLEILTNILQDPGLQSTYLVIDALDECVTDLPLLLDFIVGKSSISSQVKWIVSSRNWPNIEEHLETATQKVRICLELNEKSISTAVGIYIRYKVDQLAQEKKYGDKLRNAVQRHLCSNANDTFLWVALVCQSLRNTSRLNTMANLAAFPRGLDSLYERMLQSIYTSENADLCRRVLAVVAIAYRPLSMDEFKSFIELPEGAPDDLAAWSQAIGFCGSLLTLREDAIYFVHQSAKDFLLSQASNSILPSGEQSEHYTLFSRSLLVMSRTLRRDVYSLRAPGFPIYKVKQPKPDPLAAVRYSCVYWVDHLYAAGSLETDNRLSAFTERDSTAVHKFLREKFLYWLEALSLNGSISSVVLAIAKLEQLATQPGVNPQHLALVHDISRFILHFRSVIENYPLQISSSALIFSPTQSLIRQLFWRDAPEWITTKPVMESQWNELLQTLEGHRVWVRLAAFSPDGQRLASGSADGTVRLWDANAGALQQTLRGHSGWVWSVAFSPDGQWLASSSYDRTVRLWDANSGALLQTIEGHKDSVRTVTYSANGLQLASLSSDGNVRLWDANSGTLLQTLEGHKDSVTSVVFSPDSQRLASWSSDRTVRLWDANTGVLQQTLEVHKDWVWSVAFSPDGQWVASSSFDGTSRLWDANSGALLQTLKGHKDWVWSVAFSPDSQRLASSSSDGTLRLWDAISGTLQQTLKGHRDWVFSVAFSPDGQRLASGSADRTVRFWDAITGALFQTLEGHTGWVRSVAFSPDGQRLASTSADGTVRLWDTNSGALLQTLEGHRDSFKSVAFSPDGQWLASLSLDGTLRLWDANTGAQQRAYSVAPTSGLSRIDDLKIVTDGGVINLDNISEYDDTEGLESRNSKSVGCGFSNDKFWVTWDGENVLWLPPEYRPTSSTTSAIAKQKIAIGCSSGRVLLIGFSADVGKSWASHCSYVQTQTPHDR